MTIDRKLPLNTDEPFTRLNFVRLPHPVPPEVVGFGLPIGSVSDLTVWSAMCPTRIRSAGLTRQREFIAGRLCARRCVQTLGVDMPVNVRADGSPAWPRGLLGSITHHSTAAFAAASDDRHIAAIGIDSEPVAMGEALDAIVNFALTPGERQLLERSEDQSLVATVLFSARESLYKALSVHSPDQTELPRSLVSYHLGVVTFAWELPSGDQLTQRRALQCHYALEAGVVHTSCIVPCLT